MQLRNIPSVESVIKTPELDALSLEYPREWIIDVIREKISNNREDVLVGKMLKMLRLFRVKWKNIYKN